MIDELLKDNYSLEQARQIQDKYVKIVKMQYTKKHELLKFNQIDFIVGIDISFFKIKNQEYGIACAVLWDYHNNRIIEKYFSNGILNFPYEPGFLGFRECKLLSQAINKSRMKPDIIICDGHGIIHPKGFGEAVQLGLALNIPTIGIAKKPYYGYYNLSNFIRNKGNKNPIYNKDPNTNLNAKIIGYSISLSNNRAPVFISEGFKIKINDAIRIALKISKNHKQPEPLFLADKYSRLKIKELKFKID